MLRDSIIARLKDLKYQGNLKKSNISVISKNNEYGDIVKFYAQINKEDVIQRISFKATGCSTFIAMASYFCEMVDGKSVASALKVSREKLNTIVNLDESKEHVFDIILSTFALLVKKYRKGVEDKTITPSEVEEIVIDEQNKAKKSKSTKVALDTILEDIPVISTSKKSSKTSIDKSVKVKKDQLVNDEKEKTASDFELIEKQKPSKKSKEIITSDAPEQECQSYRSGQ